MQRHNLSRAFSDSISFTGSNLGGTIPSTIGLLTNLEYVRIGGSQVRGTIPTELGSCPKLHKLSFEVSQLSGTLPVQFAALGYLGKERRNAKIIGVCPHFFEGKLTLAHCPQKPFFFKMRKSRSSQRKCAEQVSRSSAIVDFVAFAAIMPADVRDRR